MKKIILLAFISLTFLSVKAQENLSSDSSKSETKQKYHALGFNAGFSTGFSRL